MELKEAEAEAEAVFVETRVGNEEEVEAVGMVAEAFEMFILLPLLPPFIMFISSALERVLLFELFSFLPVLGELELKGVGKMEEEVVVVVEEKLGEFLILEENNSLILSLLLFIISWGKRRK